MTDRTEQIARTLDDEPLTEFARLKGEVNCTMRCTQCEDSDASHHWLEECDDEGEPIEVCMHCNAWREAIEVDHD